MSITTKIYNEQTGSPFIIEAEGLSNDFSKNSKLDALKEWKEAHSEFLKEKLMLHGAVLIRNFGVNTVPQFDDFLRFFKESALLDYAGGNSPRTKLSTGIYTSTEYPAEHFISLHNELSYSDEWPDHLFFCCETPPNEKGNTLIADGRKVLQLLNPEVVEMFQKKKVRYIRNLHGGSGLLGPSWQDTFETQERNEVSEFCKKSNIECEWKSDGSLRTIQTGLGVATHPITKEKAWFNQADQFHPSNHPRDYYEALADMCDGRLEELPTHACFGDGSEIPDEVLDDVRNAFKQLTIYFPWQQGDILVIDNVLMAHGRAPYSGPRKILVAMS
jgi:alpha-ketoglutarate-dependent taurine dioxygenase